MPYTCKPLLDPKHFLNEIEQRLPAMQQILAQELPTLTNAESFELLQDLRVLNSLLIKEDDYKQQISTLINQLVGNKKQDFVEKNELNSYPLSVEDLVLLVDHFRTKGITIYIEQQCAAVPLQQFPQDHSSKRHTNDINTLREILSIQQTLDEHQYVGYLFTGGRTKGHGHFECCIIGKDRIIKPVYWNGDAVQLKPSEFAVDYSTNMYDFCGLFSYPQAGTSECGSLSLAYLKNLLKNNSDQINNWTLCIPYYSAFNRSNPQYFFLPSPQVLRYSQSNAYNELFVTMLQNDDYSFIMRYGKQQRIPSIKIQLEKTIQTAQLTKNETVEAQARLLLKNLPEFKEKWLQQYQLEKEQRQGMQTAKHNAYLAYTSQRMHKRALLKEHQSNAPALTLLQQKIASAPSLQALRLYLKKELAAVAPSSASELGWLLNKTNNSVFFELLDWVGSFVKTTDYFRILALCLTPMQVRELIQHLRQPEQFSRIVQSDEVKDFYMLRAWLECLRIPKSQTVAFIKTQHSKAWIIDNLKKDIGFGISQDHLKIYQEPQEFTNLVKEYVGMDWIVSLLPELFKKQNLYRLELIFSDKEEFTQLLIHHLNKEVLQSYFAATPSAMDISLMARHYVNRFNEEQQSQIFFKVIGVALLTRLLEMNEPKWMLELLENCCTVAEIRPILVQHHEMLIKALLYHQTIYPFNVFEKLQLAVENRLEFFCPQQNEDLIKLYQEHFADVGTNRSKQYYLEKLITFLPEQQRWAFLERLFNAEEIQQLLRIDDLARCIPKKPCILIEVQLESAQISLAYTESEVVAEQAHGSPETEKTTTPDEQLARTEALVSPESLIRLATTTPTPSQQESAFCSAVASQSGFYAIKATKGKHPPKKESSLPGCIMM
ncbi:MAG: hypothetical protein ACHP65_07395 [Legionellales bacterium]